MPEVRIAAWLAADADEVELMALVVDTQQLGDVPIARRNRPLLAPALRVVEIQVPPVVAFRKPDRFVRGRQIAPVGRAIARLEEGFSLLLQHLPNRAGRRVAEPQLLTAEIAGGAGGEG